jgi:hypothetical protein
MALLGQAVLMNWSSVPLEDRELYYEWHVRDHMVGRIELDGFHRGRRYIAARAERDFFQFYEVANVETFNSAAYRAKSGSPNALTRRASRLIRDSLRAVGHIVVTVGAGQGGYLATVRLRVDDGELAAAETSLAQILSLVVALPGVVSAHLCKTDWLASGYELRAAANIPDFTVLIEGISLSAIEHACDVAWPAVSLPEPGRANTIMRGLFEHELTLTKADLPDVRSSS